MLIFVFSSNLQMLGEITKMQYTQPNESKNPASKIYSGLNSKIKIAHKDNEVSLSYFLPTTFENIKIKLIKLALTTEGEKLQI